MLVLVVTVRVLFPEPAIGFTLNVGLAPEGSPVTLKLTLPLKLPDGVTVAVKRVELPAVTACEAGDAESKKFPELAEFTTKVTVAEWEKPPPVPVIVSV